MNLFLSAAGRSMIRWHGADVLDEVVSLVDGSECGAKSKGGGRDSGRAKRRSGSKVVRGKTRLVKTERDQTIQDRHEAVVSGASGNLVHRASVVKQSRAGGRVQHRRDLGVWWWRNKERDGVQGSVTAKVGRKVKGGRQRDWTKLLDTYLHQQRVRQRMMDARARQGSFGAL